MNANQSLINRGLEVLWLSCTPMKDHGTLPALPALAVGDVAWQGIELVTT